MRPNKIINLEQFQAAFSIRPDNFSPTGLSLVYAYLDQPTKVDAIELCGAFMEESLDYLLDYYEQPNLEALKEYLTVIGCSDTNRPSYVIIAR